MLSRNRPAFRRNVPTLKNLFFSDPYSVPFNPDRLGEALQIGETLAVCPAECLRRRTPIEAVVIHVGHPPRRVDVGQTILRLPAVDGRPDRTVPVGRDVEIVSRQAAQDVVHPVPDGTPLDERVADQHEPILHAELEDVSAADDLVADEIPRAAMHGLEAEGVVMVVVDAVAPHSNVGLAVVRLQPVIGDVVDVVSVDVAIPFGIRDAVGRAGDVVVGHHVTARMSKLDSFAAEVSYGGVVVADDHVVGDVPVAAVRPEMNRVVEALETVSADHDVDGLVSGPQPG